MQEPPLWLTAGGRGCRVPANTAALSSKAVAVKKQGTGRPGGCPPIEAHTQGKGPHCFGDSLGAGPNGISHAAGPPPIQQLGAPRHRHHGCQVECMRLITSPLSMRFNNSQSELYLSFSVTPSHCVQQKLVSPARMPGMRRGYLSVRLKNNMPCLRKEEGY